MADNSQLRAFNDTVHFTQICIDRGNMRLAKEQYVQLAATYAALQSSALSHDEKVRAHASLSELHQALTGSPKPNAFRTSVSQAGFSSPFPSLPTSLPPSILPPLQPPSLAASDSHHAAFIFGAFVILTMLGSSVFLEPTLVGLATVNIGSSSANQPPVWLKEELFVKGTSTINLNQYVVDPDGDTLVFEASVESGSIDAIVEENYLSITANKPGVAFLVVTASDLKSVRRARLRIITS